MINVNSIDWNSLTNELKNHYKDKYRTIWLDYTRLGSVCITAFPKDPNSRYVIFTKEKLNKINLQVLIDIIN